MVTTSDRTKWNTKLVSDFGKAPLWTLQGQGFSAGMVHQWIVKYWVRATQFSSKQWEYMCTCCKPLYEEDAEKRVKNWFRCWYRTNSFCLTRYGCDDCWQQISIPKPVQRWDEDNANLNSVMALIHCLMWYLWQRKPLTNGWNTCLWIWMTYLQTCAILISTGAAVHSSTWARLKKGLLF